MADRRHCCGTNRRGSVRPGGSAGPDLVAPPRDGTDGLHREHGRTHRSGRPTEFGYRHRLRLDCRHPRLPGPADPFLGAGIALGDASVCGRLRLYRSPGVRGARADGFARAHGLGVERLRFPADPLARWGSGCAEPSALPLRVPARAHGVRDPGGIAGGRRPRPWRRLHAGVLHHCVACLSPGGRRRHRARNDGDGRRLRRGRLLRHLHVHHRHLQNLVCARRPRRGGAACRLAVRRGRPAHRRRAGRTPWRFQQPRRENRDRRSRPAFRRSGMARYAGLCAAAHPRPDRPGGRARAIRLRDRRSPARPRFRRFRDNHLRRCRHERRARDAPRPLVGLQCAAESAPGQSPSHAHGNARLRAARRCSGGWRAGALDWYRQGVSAIPERPSSTSA